MSPHLKFVGNRFDSFQKNGNGYRALCPMHDDSSPSLSLAEGKNGGVVIRCMAGCPTDAVLEVVGLRLRDLMPGAEVVDQIYSYFDADGKLLYQAVRMFPKSFRQRSPDGNGGWVWSTKDCPKVLYRLPELLASPRRERLLIVEGEKDVDRLVAMGFSATCNVGGAGKWLTDYSETLRDRHVAILADNDAPGRDHAEFVAGCLSGVAASVKVVELPNLPEKGDVSDWLDGGGTADQLRDLLLATPTHRPSQPSSGDIAKGKPKGTTHRVEEKTLKTGVNCDGLSDGLDAEGGDSADGSAAEPDGSTQRVQPVLPFPTSALPGLLARFVTTAAAALPCPPDFIGVMMLAVMGSLIGRKRQIEIKKGWREYALLWVAIVARSGERKSPAFALVTEPLRLIQKALLHAFRKAKKEHAAIPSKERGDTPAPRLKQCLTTDTTIEALKDVLADNPNGVIYAADELAGWARGIGQYKAGSGDDKQIWLSIWSSTQIVSNRRGNPEPIVIDDPFVAITGGIQPDALPDLIDDAREDGFPARILFASPKPVPQGNWTDTTVDQSTDYLDLCKQLYDLKAIKEPHRVDAEAKQLWIKWVNDHRAESPPDNLRPTWSKAEGHLLRIVLIIHLTRQLCNETKSVNVDAKSMEGGIELIEYFKSHAHKVYGNLHLYAGKDRLSRALKWVRKHGGTVTARQARLNGFCPNIEDAVQLFQDLEHHGHGHVTKGRNNSVLFTLRTDAQPEEK